MSHLRDEGLSAQTCNHHLKAAKQFTRWLVRDRRTPTDPLAHLSKLNVRTDRRHDRRALWAEELKRLLEAARTGPRIEGIRACVHGGLAFLALDEGADDDRRHLSKQGIGAQPPDELKTVDFRHHHIR